MAGNPWPPAWQNALCELAECKYSAREIADLMSARFQHAFTRHSVAKKLRRIGLRGVLPKRRERVLLPVAPEAGECPEAPGDNSPALTGKPIAEIGLFECRYEITGTKNKRAYRFCAEPVRMEHPYSFCEKHCAIVYQESYSLARMSPTRKG